MDNRLVSAFAIIAVTLIAFGGISIISEDSDAALGSYTGGTPTATESNPYTGVSCTAEEATGHDLYVAVGSTVSISSDEYFSASTVTSGFGLSVSSGNITGTISKPGTISLVFTMIETGDPERMSIYAVSLEEDIDFTSPAAVEALSGASVSYTATTNVDATFSKVSGTATGLTVNSSTGKVSGTLPKVTGSSPQDYTLTIKATSKTNSSNTAQQTITFTVYPALTISPSSSTTISGTEDKAITAVQLSTNLDSTFTKSSGTWPSGISMTSSGKISGTPTSPSTATVVVKATATEGPSQSVTTTIRFDIDAAEATLSITVGTPKASYLPGDSVSLSLTSNVTGTTWSLSGTASSFLDVSGSTVAGSIPAQQSAGDVKFMVTAETPNGQTASKEVTLTVEAKIQFTSAPTASCVINPVFEYDEDGNLISSQASSLIPEVLADDGASFSFPDTLKIQATFTGERADSIVWDWGDGTTDTGNKVTHEYKEPGTYTITLTASNDVGDDVVEITVTVGDSVIDWIYWGVIALLVIIVILLVVKIVRTSKHSGRRF